MDTWRSHNVPYGARVIAWHQQTWTQGDKRRYRTEQWGFDALIPVNF